MRRMLDPKEVEGGSSTIYMHCIQLYGGGIGNILVSCYNTNQDKFTMASFEQFMKNKKLPCTGCISKVGKEKLRLMYIDYNSINRRIEAWYYDIDNPSQYHPISVKQMNIEDLVSPL